MKRTVTALIACVLALSVVGILAGCQQFGIGAPTGVPQKKTAQVSAPAIAQEGVLRVGVNSENAPFSTIVDGRLVGIDVDMAAAIASELGLSVQLVDVKSEGEKALSKGTVDIIMGMDKSDTAASCWLSDPYIETAAALFATSSGAIMPAADSNPTIEAQESSMSAWEVTNQFGEKSLRTVSDLKEAFGDLANGKVTFVAADVVIGSYINRTSDSKAQIIGLLQTPGGYCVGVSAANNDLKMAIANAVDAIDNNGVAGVVQQKWLGTALDLSGYTLSEAASKASGANKKPSEVSGVGSNAVNPSDGQTTSETPAETPVIEQEYTDYSAEQTYTEPAYTEPVYTEPAPEPEYTEPAPEPEYTEPAPEPEPVTEESTGGEGYTEDNGGTGEGEAA